MDETTGSAWIGAFRNAVVDCGVACRDAVVDCGVAFHDAIWGSRGACHDAIVVDIVDVATDPMCGDAILGCEVACRNADMGGTADLTAGP